MSAALLVGAALIVAGGFALANERVRPEDFRRLGVLFAVGATVLFAVRDNVLRAIARDTSVDALVAAPVSLLAGATTVALYLLVTRRGAWSRGYGTTLRAFLPAGLLFGLSYTALFQAYYRGRVSVVAPLVATESLWGVAFSALLLRRTRAGRAAAGRRRDPDRGRRRAHRRVPSAMHAGLRPAITRRQDPPSPLPRHQPRPRTSAAPGLVLATRRLAASSKSPAIIQPWAG